MGALDLPKLLRPTICILRDIVWLPYYLTGIPALLRYRANAGRENMSSHPVLGDHSLLVSVFRHLPAQDLLNARRVSRAFRSAADDPSLWTALYKARYTRAPQPAAGHPRKAFLARIPFVPNHWIPKRDRVLSMLLLAASTLTCSLCLISSGAFASFMVGVLVALDIFALPSRSAWEVRGLFAMRLSSSLCTFCMCLMRLLKHYLFCHLFTQGIAVDDAGCLDAPLGIWITVTILHLVYFLVVVFLAPKEFDRGPVIMYTFVLPALLGLIFLLPSIIRLIVALPTIFVFGGTAIYSLWGGLMTMSIGRRAAEYYGAPHMYPRCLVTAAPVLVAFLRKFCAGLPYPNIIFHSYIILFLGVIFISLLHN